MLPFDSMLAGLLKCYWFHTRSFNNFIIFITSYFCCCELNQILKRPNSGMFEGMGGVRSFLVEIIPLFNLSLGRKCPFGFDLIFYLTLNIAKLIFIWMPCHRFSNSSPCSRDDHILWRERGGHILRGNLPVQARVMGSQYWRHQTCCSNRNLFQYWRWVTFLDRSLFSSKHTRTDPSPGVF